MGKALVMTAALIMGAVVFVAGFTAGSIVTGFFGGKCEGEYDYPLTGRR